MSMTEEELADMITTYRRAADAASGELRRGLVTGPAYRRFSADVGSPMSVRMLLDLLEDARAERDQARTRIAELEARRDPAAQVLVEGSWFHPADLPDILGNYMRACDDYAQMAKNEHAKRLEIAAQNEFIYSQIRREAEASVALDRDERVQTYSVEKLREDTEPDA